MCRRASIRITAFVSAHSSQTRIYSSSRVLRLPYVCSAWSVLGSVKVPMRQHEASAASRGPRRVRLTPPPRIFAVSESVHARQMHGTVCRSTSIEAMHPEHLPLLSGRTCPVVVLDTHVVLDGWWFVDPRARELVLAIEAGHLAWQATPDMRAELVDVLGRSPFAARSGLVSAALAAFDRWARPRPAPRPVNAPCCTDPDDQMFIDLAIDAGARWLFSRDRAVTSLARALAYRGCVVLAPEAWAANPSLTVSQEKLCACSAAAGALPEASEQRVAEVVSQSRDRVIHVPLRAQDCRGGCNPREGQALGAR
jgi:uncharacterized protein